MGETSKTKGGHLNESEAQGGLRVRLRSASVNESAELSTYTRRSKHLEYDELDQCRREGKRPRIDDATSIGDDVEKPSMTSQRQYDNQRTNEQSSLEEKKNEREEVSRIFGLANSGLEVPTDCLKGEDTEILALYNLKGGEIKVGDIESNLHEFSWEEFKAKFLLYTITTMLNPLTGLRVSLKHVGLLRDLEGCSHLK